LTTRIKTLVGVLAAVPALALPASAAATTLLGSGSSAELPALQALFKGYKKVKPSVNFIYNANGGNAGVKDVQNGVSQFAVETRPQLNTDQHSSFAKLFLDGLCVGVNPANKLSNLSISRTRSIFTDVITNWRGVPGSNLATTIDAVGRDSSAGTYTFFQATVLNGQTQASNVNPLSSDGLVATAIKKDRNAIGYVGLSHSGPGSHVKRLKLNGVPCDATHIKRESYPLWRFIWFVLPTGHAPERGPSRAAQQFADWVRTSKAAGQIISKAGAVPAFNKS
jgi:phosphate transport system substrate-binding protein